MTVTTSDIRGRVALVTGANRGIGRAIALALGAAGAHVAVNDRAPQEEAEPVCGQIAGPGARSISVAADVSVGLEVGQLVDAVERELGPIEILVNNAAIARPQPVEEITEADWDEIIANNLKSAFLVTQAVLPSMRERRFGRIIYISSAAAQLGGVVGPHYAASKAGMLGLTHSYAALLANEGITVNAVAPALIDTEMIRSNPRARPELTPVGRFGLPEEVASVVVMLAGNGYVTGQTINVNGGWYMS